MKIFSSWSFFFDSVDQTGNLLCDRSDQSIYPTKLSTKQLDNVICIAVCQYSHWGNALYYQSTWRPWYNNTPRCNTCVRWWNPAPFVASLQTQKTKHPKSSSNSRVSSKFSIIVLTIVEKVATGKIWKLGYWPQDRGYITLSMIVKLMSLKDRWRLTIGTTKWLQGFGIRHLGQSTCGNRHIHVLAGVPALRCGVNCSFHGQWCWFSNTVQWFVGYVICNTY